MNALRQMAQRLGYMDANGNFADESGYAIDMSFANPMSEQAFAQQTPGYNVADNEAEQIAQSNRYKNSINRTPYPTYPNGHWMYSDEVGNGQ